MTTTIQDREKAIDNFNLNFVLEKIENENTLNKEELPKIEIEFKKFMKLVLREDGPLAMLDKRVDEFWHSFILFTPQYQEFCEKVIGFFVHHQPRTSYTPVPILAINNFIDAYKKQYIILDPFWYETLTPELVRNIKNNSVQDLIIHKWSGWIGKKNISKNEKNEPPTGVLQ